MDRSMMDRGLYKMGGRLPQISKSDMRSMEDWWLITTTAAVGHFSRSWPWISKLRGTWAKSRMNVTQH